MMKKRPRQFFNGETFKARVWGHKVYSQGDFNALCSVVEQMRGDLYELYDLKFPYDEKYERALKKQSKKPRNEHQRPDLRVVK